MEDLTLTVKDVLKRKTFKGAKVIAGEEGLHRQVKWVHIIEKIDSLEIFVNGHELILTTGIGLDVSLATRLKFINKLIKIDAACLCIEKGSYFEEIPAEIVQLANDNQFPIILFEKTVRFVEITQDLHTSIVNHHHERLSMLDTISQRFLSLSLSPNGLLKILQELHNFFQSDALFISKDIKSSYYPMEVKDREISIRNYVLHNAATFTEPKIMSVEEQAYAVLPISSMNQVWGYLCLQSEQAISDEFTFLVLDRAALAIAQILLRNRTTEERKLNNEDELVWNLLNGQMTSTESFQTYFPITRQNKLKVAVYVIQMDLSEKKVEEYGWSEIKLRLSMIVRSIFKRSGFTTAISVNKSEIVIIVLYPVTPIYDDKERFLRVTNQIKAIDNKFIQGDECHFGMSKTYDNLTMIPEAYKESKLVLQMQKATLTESIFYNELGAYRLLIQFKNKEMLRSFANDYLQKLLDYDKEMGSNLFETLQVYLQCGGSKKETAERLFIVRQTLYQRIDKIEAVLGDDFMAPLNRITLEIAMMAYEIVNRLYDD